MSEALLARIAELEAQITDLKAQHAADRTHLRDDARTVRNNAFNLLNEEVIFRVQLIAVALNRPRPKVDSALHFAELLQEICEKQIRTFM